MKKSSLLKSVLLQIQHRYQLVHKTFKEISPEKGLLFLKQCFLFKTVAKTSLAVSLVPMNAFNDV